MRGMRGIFLRAPAGFLEGRRFFYIREREEKVFFLFCLDTNEYERYLRNCLSCGFGDEHEEGNFGEF